MKSKNNKLFSKNLGIIAIVPAVILFSSVSLGAPCGAAAFSSKQLSKDADWRKQVTQPSQSGDFAKTSAARESNIASVKRSMEDFILHFKGEWGLGDTPPMEFVAADGVSTSYLSQSNGLGGVITRISVSNLGPSGVIKGTLLLPVSGHLGNAKAKEWAKQDTYTIRTDLNPNNTKSTHGSWGGTGNETDLITDVKSLDLVTAQEIEIPL
ncbi:MAG: hypothetical protein AABZ06_13750, partial [Bdellovibrionota bacterium]